MMSKLLKFLKYAVLTIVALVIIGVVLFVYNTEIELAYNKAFFEPPTTIAGVAVGDSRSDVVFRLGTGLSGEDCTYCDENSMLWKLGTESTPEYIQAVFTNGLARTVTSTSTAQTFGRRYVLNNTERLLDMLGEPDILAVSSNLLNRRYTYLEWGVTLEYAQNDLTSVMIGEVEWRSTGDQGVGSEYSVMGKQICPGSDCPWDDAGELKPGYEDKSYREFL